jgi:membrane protein required for colicin V production
MTFFDIIAALVLIVSAIVGFVRGATKELMTVLAFLGAAIVSVAALRFTAPLARQAIHPDWAAVAVAIAAIFILAYILLRLLGNQLARGVHESDSMGVLDRAVGMGFGLIRALVILGVFNLLFNMAVGSAQPPQWVERSKLFPLSATAGRILHAFAPNGLAFAGKVAPVVEKAVRDQAAPSEGETQPDEKSKKPAKAGPKDAGDRKVEKSR